MKKVVLTVREMTELACRNGDKIADSRVAGLQAWSMQKGVVFYFVKKIKGRQYSQSIGRYPDISIEDARRETLHRLSMAADEQNISRGNSSPLVSEVLEFYLDSLRKKSTRRTFAPAVKHLACIFSQRVTAVTPQVVQDLHAQISKHTPKQANIAVQILRAAVNHYNRMFDLSLPNPVRHIKFNPCEPRERYLSLEEFARMREALIELAKRPLYAAQADAILMLLYTGARKQNVLQMRIEEIHDNVWTIPSEKFKTDHEQSIELGHREMEIIERYRGERKTGFVFVRKDGRRYMDLRQIFHWVRKMTGLNDLHLHDLRRTIGTWMLSNGVPLAVISKKLGHRSIRTTERVYARVMPNFTREATERTLDRMFAGSLTTPRG